jgi:hypothetical protein
VLLGDQGDVGLAMTRGRSRWARWSSVGLGRRALELYQGRHALADVDAELSLPPSTVDGLDVAGRRSTVLLFEDGVDGARGPLDVTLTRARARGGYFGVKIENTFGSTRLEDVEVGASSVTGGAEGGRDHAGLRLDVQALEADRLWVHHRRGRGLHILPTSAPRPGHVRIADLTVATSATMRDTRLCLSDATPGATIDADQSHVTLARAAVVDVHGRGLLVRLQTTSTATLSDLRFVDVPCRVLDVRGDLQSGRRAAGARVERLHIARQRFERESATLDDLLSVTEGGWLVVEDFDARVAAARSVLRVNREVTMRLTRWRARGALSLLTYGDMFVAPSEVQLRDGVAEGLAEVTLFAPLSCEDLARAPPFLRVPLPEGLPVFRGCR